MSLRIVVDMNLSAEWIGTLQAAGYDAVHWSKVGPATADDEVIMAWANENDRVVLTHDLDFGTVLALTGADGPSVVQIRTQRVLPEHLSSSVIAILKKYQAELLAGSIVVADEGKHRVRLLPIRHDR